jgi:hypothetical protein
MQIIYHILIIVGIIDMILYFITPFSFRITKIPNHWFRYLLPCSGIYLFISYLKNKRRLQNLEESLISYEDCKKLRTLGFNEPCQGYFTEINGGEITFILKEYNINDNNHLLRPTYEQAYKFLLALKFDTQ